MSALTMAQQIQVILQAALASVTPTVTVRLGVPPTLKDNLNVYIFHNGSKDVAKGTTVIRRFHEFVIRVELRSDVDPMTAETTLLGLHDTIANAFYTNRTLNGTAATSTIQQLDAPGGNRPPFVLETTGGTFRQRWFSLETAEDIAFTFA